MKILVVEDDATSREFLLQLVRKNGYEGVATEDGEQAWTILSEENAPPLIILDRILPGIDGETLCRHVRSMEHTVPPYIIMLTVKGDKADIVSGLDAGADDYLSKPFDPDELRARIGVGRRVLDLEMALDSRIKEKELLLHEVHHRIKNNMFIISSLLELQSAAIDNPAASTALMEANSRLRSMGILYDRLYKQDNLQEMPIGDYLQILLHDIVEQFPNRDSVNVLVNMDDFVLPPKTLSTIGIIINELATNAMKYAFPDGRLGTITLSGTTSGGRVRLSLTDDGIGIPTSIDCGSSGGFGLQLVGIMTEQLKGTVTISRETGSRFDIEFGIVMPLT